MPRVKHMDLRTRDVFAISFRLSRIERKIMLTPEHQKPWLCLLHPRLPFWVGHNVGAIIVKEISLNLGLTGCTQERILIGPEVGVVELNSRVVPDMTGFGG